MFIDTDDAEKFQVLELLNRPAACCLVIVSRLYYYYSHIFLDSRAQHCDYATTLAGR